MSEIKERAEQGLLLHTDNGTIKSNYYGWKQEVKPASRVWSGEFPTTQEARAEFYFREGFVVFRNLLGREELAELKAEADRFERDYRSIPHVREGFDLEPTQDPTKPNPTFRKIGGICTLSDAYNRLMRHPTLLGFMHRIIGPDVALFLDAIYPKAARVGREKPWHQDQAFWKWKPHDVTIQTMTALDDCNVENACLQLLPRSQREFLQHSGREACLTLDDEQQARAIYLPLKAGDVVAFHSLLLHASEPNTSDQERRSVFISYCPPSLQYVGNKVPHELVPVLPL